MTGIVALTAQPANSNHTIAPPISFADHVKLSRETTGKTLP
jgi:hypothetical protein